MYSIVPTDRGQRTVRAPGQSEGEIRWRPRWLAGTGMRIGEAAGLHLGDLDLDNGVIYVRRSVWNGKELNPRPQRLSDEG
jgi:integrase